MPKSMSRLVHLLSSSSLSIKIPLSQNQEHYCVCQETLINRKIFFYHFYHWYVSHNPSIFFAHSISNYFCSYEPLIESTELSFIVYFSELLKSSFWKKIWVRELTMVFLWNLLRDWLHKDKSKYWICMISDM